MKNDRFLVTGALGCIGAWTVKNLIEAGVEVFTFDLNQNLKRLQLIMPEENIRMINFIQGDISNLSDVTTAFNKSRPTHVIHLAALQLPFCKANPPLGAAVNIVGTVNLFEAVIDFNFPAMVYASSTAVYGTSEEYPEGRLDHNAALKPRSHYGVYKQANEGSARVYWLENKINSLGLRPYTVYGAGRDQGLTSTPTKAMLAAALGRPYHISYGGRCAFQYADDMAKTFILAAKSNYVGTEVFNVGGESVSMPEVIAAIEQVEPSIKGKITFENIRLPFPEEVDNSELVKIVGELPNTPLLQGVAETISYFNQALKSGLITQGEVDKILS